MIINLNRQHKYSGNKNIGHVFIISHAVDNLNGYVSSFRESKLHDVVYFYSTEPGKESDFKWFRHDVKEQAKDIINKPRLIGILKDGRFTKSNKIVNTSKGFFNTYKQAFYLSVPDSVEAQAAVFQAIFLNSLTRGGNSIMSYNINSNRHMYPASDLDIKRDLGESTIRESFDSSTPIVGRNYTIIPKNDYYIQVGSNTYSISFNNLESVNKTKDLKISIVKDVFKFNDKTTGVECLKINTPKEYKVWLVLRDKIKELNSKSEYLIGDLRKMPVDKLVTTIPLNILEKLNIPPF